MQIASGKRTTNIILFLAIIVLFSSVSLFAANAAFAVRDEIYTGVKIANIPVGGLSEEEARTKLTTLLNDRLAKNPLILIYKDREWTIQPTEIKLSADIDSLIKQAYQVGRSGNIIQRLQERYITINKGYQLPINFAYDKEKLSEILTSIATTLNQEPQSARVVLHGVKIVSIPDTEGLKVDVEATTKAINDKINADSLPYKVSLVVNVTKPNIVLEDLKSIDDLIASYTTQFNSQNENRVQNIRLAAKSVNNILLRPGETFSFNQTVGLRLAEYGYKEAPVFINGKLVPDWGGGVCQVSSTLYNAVLLADMNILERTSHYRPPGYVPLGQDATVADNLLDFRFSNSSDHNIFIGSELTDTHLTIYVFGKSEKRPEITVTATDKKVIEPNTIVKQDPELELGKEVVESEGEKGFQVTTYRIKQLNGKEISRELLAKDEFPPDDRIVRVGTKNLHDQK